MTSSQHAGNDPENIPGPPEEPLDRPGYSDPVEAAQAAADELAPRRRARRRTRQMV